MKEIELVGFGYATGTSWCDKNRKGETAGYYKELAYVWESGKIDWKEDPEKLPEDIREGIYKCSESNIKRVNELKHKVEEKITQYPDWRTMTTDTIEKFYARSFISESLIRLEDLEKHNTTQVIHY